MTAATEENHSSHAVGAQTPRPHKRRRMQKTVAKYNRVILAKIQRALEENPSVDLQAIIPPDYASRRMTICSQERRVSKGSEDELCSAEAAPFHTLPRTDLTLESEVLETCAPGNSATAMFELSDQAIKALAITREEVQDKKTLATALTHLLKNSVILCCPTTQTCLCRCSEELVVKCFVPDETSRGLDSTEHTAMQYLQQHLPNIPAPRPHGLIASEGRAYLFMTYVSGSTLEAVWSQLTSEQKHDIRNQLQHIINEMQSHHKPDHMFLGGIGGEGCKDTRRFTRISSSSLTCPAAFWDFVYSQPRGPSVSYVRAVQSWLQSRQDEPCVFTHGDLRPANVHVSSENGTYRITGLLDWEKSGFYPESWEACKITNCMSTLDQWDWFSYLPISASPARFPGQWLRDQFWDTYVVHQAGLV